MDDIIEVLAKVDTFKGLARDDLGLIARRCRRDTYGGGQTIFNCGDPSTDVYFVKSGAVKITMFSPTGKEIAFREMEAGDMFGEISAIDQLPRSTAAVSCTDVELIRLSDQDFLDVLRRFPDVAIVVMQRVAFLVRALSDRVVEYSSYDVRHRIHAELLRLARAHWDGSKIVNIHPAPTHADIANMVTTHREAVTRELKRLTKEEGILEQRGRVLIIYDIKRLERLVTEDDC